MVVQGRIGSLQIFIAILIYFVCVIVIVNVAQNFNNTINTNSIGNLNISDDLLKVGFYSCSSPSDTDNNFIMIKNNFLSYTDCRDRPLYSKEEFEIGSYVNLSKRCNSINGCSWYTNITPDNLTLSEKYMAYFRFLGWSESNNLTEQIGVCDGTINYSYYGADITNSQFERGSGFCTSYWNVNNKTNCETFGCSWNQPPKDTISITKTIGLMFTLNLDFDIDNGGFWDKLLQFLLFGIPFILLIGAGYILFIG
jgi:hypothetical protein